MTAETTSEYTPTTDEVREDFAFRRTHVPFYSAQFAATMAREREAFNRWLARHDAEVRAEAEATGARVVSPQGEWITAVGVERRRQREQGYTDERDREQGADFLLDLAIEYGRRGEAVKAAALVQAARQVVAHALAEAEARGAREALLSAADAIEAEGADYDAESTLSLVLSRLRVRAEQAGDDRD